MSKYEHAADAGLTARSCPGDGGGDARALGAEYREAGHSADGIEPLPEGNGIGVLAAVEDSTGHEPVLAPHILSRVRDLVREGREAEAVEMVREATGMDVYRAREAVALVRRNTEG